MGVLLNLTKEYFEDIERTEDLIKGVLRVSFTDKNGVFHKRGYQPQNKDALIEIVDILIEERGNEGDFNDIDTSLIEDMNGLFFECNAFNGDISGWDTSKVTDMSFMFYDAEKFNKPIGKWDVSSVTDMESMFGNAESFNKDISEWEISEGVTVDDMFKGCPIKDEYKPKN